MASIKDITIYDNEWFSLDLTYKVDGAVVDLTGYGFTVDIGALACADPLLTLTIGSGVTVDAANGSVKIRATKAQLTTAGIVAGGTAFKYRITHILPTGEPKVVMTGKLKVVC